MQDYIKLTKKNENELVQLLTEETWPYHGTENPKEDKIKQWLSEGYYSENGTETFLIQEDNKIIGMLRIFDLEDESCLFDLRIKAAYRGQKRGGHSVKWLTAHVFSSFAHIARIEGHTRHDNLAMRKTFHNAGYVKEAYHRSAWPQGNTLYDSVGYAITKSDWEQNITTPIKDSFPF